MKVKSTKLLVLSLAILIFFFFFCSIPSSASKINGQSPPYIWPLPSEFVSGDETLTVNPNLSLSLQGVESLILTSAFDRYKAIIFKHRGGTTESRVYDLNALKIVVYSDNEDLQLGTDESYTLYVAKKDEKSIIDEATIEANTVFGAVRGLETLSQLCIFDYDSKSVVVHKAPWFIQDKPRFPYRGLLLDTSRHYFPIDVIKQIIESMSYAKLNVLHWHIIDEESFPIEIPSHPDLWKGAYTKSERYTVEDAIDIVNYAKLRGINVMAEVDVPGHGESWGTGYPDLWPSSTCREPLDVSKNYTFDVLNGILSDMRKIFPFELFHLGGDEVHPSCWNSTPHINQWLQDKNITLKEAYQYFVTRAQEIAVSKNWSPVNWEETFSNFAEKLHPRTVVHNWLVSGICPKAVAEGLRCIFSNQGVWYLDHLDVPWNEVYSAEPHEGIDDEDQKQLVIGGEVCMWGETVDTSNVQTTIWPRAAAAAERLWSRKETTSTGNLNETTLPRLQYFRCLLNRRGVQAAPVTNFYARTAPIGAGSCFDQ